MAAASVRFALRRWTAWDGQRGSVGRFREGGWILSPPAWLRGCVSVIAYYTCLRARRRGSGRNPSNLRRRRTTKKKNFISSSRHVDCRHTQNHDTQKQTHGRAQIATYEAHFVGNISLSSRQSPAPSATRPSPRHLELYNLWTGIATTHIPSKRHSFEVWKSRKRR